MKKTQLFIFVLFSRISLFCFAGGMDTVDLVFNDGPWGRLSGNYITLEPPDSLLLPDDYSKKEIFWYFDNESIREVMDFIDQSGLSESYKSLLNKTLFKGNGHIVARPSNELIFSMSKEVRKKIYDRLARSPLNKNMASPFRLPTRRLNKWMLDCDLPQEIKDMILSMCYPSGNSTVFCDTQTVINQCFKFSDNAENEEKTRKRLIKVLAQKDAVLVEINITKTDNVFIISDYWGQGGRRKDLFSFLQSVQRSSVSKNKEATLDVVHLLPSFARSRIYTFPVISETRRDQEHDCYWTSLNFFNDIPDDKLITSQAIIEEINKDYEVIKDPVLGDVIFLYDSKNNPIHAAVYLADKLVFTKNGISLSQPWVLSIFDDMTAIYPQADLSKTKYLRSKDIKTQL